MVNFPGSTIEPITCSSRFTRSNITLFSDLNITGSVPGTLTLLLAVAIYPCDGLMSRGRSVRNPAHSYFPEPGTGKRPLQPFRRGVSAEAGNEMLPSTSPQIRFSVGAFQYNAASRNSLQSRLCARRSPPRYAAVPGSFIVDPSA